MHSLKTSGRNPLFNVFFAVVLLASVVVSACHPKSVRQGPYPVASGIVGPEGARITALDGQPFELGSDRSWDAPFFQEDRCLIDPSTRNYSAALARGARKVRIDHPAHDEPLYGILSLCGRAPYSKGPASRSYYINIPDSYVENTSGGRISLIYENFEYEPYFLRAGNPFERAQAKSWALWMARHPLTADHGDVEARTIEEFFDRRTHTGWFLRLSLGPSLNRFKNDEFARHDDTPYSADHTYRNEYTLTAGQGALNLGMGLFATERFAWHMLEFELMVGPTISDAVDQRATSYENTNFADAALLNIFLATGFTKYFRNEVFFSISAGIGFYSIEHRDQPVVDEWDERIFPRGQLLIGREWWISDYWLFGVAAAATVGGREDGYFLTGGGLRLTLSSAIGALR